MGVLVVSGRRFFGTGLTGFLGINRIGGGAGEGFASMEKVRFDYHWSHCFIQPATPAMAVRMMRSWAPCMRRCWERRRRALRGREAGLWRVRRLGVRESSRGGRVSRRDKARWRWRVGAVAMTHSRRWISSLISEARRVVWRCFLGVGRSRPARMSSES